ncbi:MAG: hypothetical protein MJ185_03730 [Treponema sp.]|nr:hypothetical protein [Treponema sp.]
MAKEEEIRASIENIDPEILKDTLAILISQNSMNTNSLKPEIQTNYKNFAQAVLDLKKKYNFPELNFFSTEADLVYVQAGDRRVLLTERNLNIERPSEPKRQTEEAQPNEKTENSENSETKDSIENAFENIKPNDNRFSRLEF